MNRAAFSEHIKGARAAAAGDRNRSERFDANSSLLGLRGRNIELPAYAGPLDLLLKLIRKNEVDIYDIPVASITEQYLAEIEAMEQRDILVAGDFLLMAATLLEIKSAMLLPAPPAAPGEDDGIDPRAELVQRLLEYQAFQSAAEEMARLEARRRMLFVRPFAPASLTGYVPLRPTAPNLKAGALQRSLQAVLERMLASSDSVTSVTRQQIPLQLRIAEVLGDLGAAGKTGLLLEELAPAADGKLLMIVTFLAILELLRAGRIEMRPVRDGSGYRFWVSAAKAAS